MADSRGPGAGDAGPDAEGDVKGRNDLEFTSCHQSPQATTAPPVTRARWWEDYDRKEISLEREAISIELNQELAGLVNRAVRCVNQSDDAQDGFYWRTHAELFNVLDVVYLIQREMGVTDDEAEAIGRATRKHVRRAMDRRRRHQLELLKAEKAR